MKSTRRIGAVVAALALASSLAACSGGQSVADACKIADTTVSEANTEMQTLMSDAMSGEGDLATMFEPINKALDEAQSKVTNPDVSKALSSVADEFKGMSDELGDYKLPDMSSIDATDPDAMAELEALQADSEELAASLEKRAAALTEAGTNLQEVCAAG